jgi:hypothetical protein
MITPPYDVASDAAREWRRLSTNVEASGEGAAARLMRQLELHGRSAAIQRFIELQCFEKADPLVQGSIGVCYAVYTEYDGRPTKRVVLEGPTRKAVTPTSTASQYILLAKWLVLCACY